LRFPAASGEKAKNKVARKQRKGTHLEVFSDKAGRANSAILDVLAKETPQNIKQILKKINKYEGLEETYYASLTKRLHSLQETGYIGEAKTAEETSKNQKSYELRAKAYIAVFLKENSIQDIIDQASDTQAAYILLALLNVFLPEKDQNNP